MRQSRLLILLAAVLMFAHSAQAGDKWEHESVVWFGMFTTLNVMDAAQTNWALDHSQKKFRDMNPIVNWVYDIGGGAGVVAYLAGANIAVYFLADMMPSRPGRLLFVKVQNVRSSLLFILSSIKLGCVGMNHSNGASMSLKF